jgi:hypothetical protein
MTGIVKGRNLRGKNVAVAAGVTSVAVGFTAAKTSGQAAIHSARASRGAGRLAAGRYYYVASLVTGHGETSATAEKTVVIAEASNQAELSFYGGGGTWKRRVYRGRAPGVYDGYYETAVGANTFVDTGGPFTGIKRPMADGVDAETDQTEPDADYAVVVTPSWNTTTYVTRKATTGFTINFGNASPPTGGTVDWMIVR